MNTTELEQFKNNYEKEDQGFRNFIRLSHGLVQVCRREYTRIQDDHEQAGKQQEERLQQFCQNLAAMAERLKMRVEMPSAEAPAAADEKKQTPDDMVQSLEYLDEMLGQLEQCFFRSEALFLTLYEELRSRPDANTQAELSQKLDRVLEYLADGSRAGSARADSTCADTTQADSTRADTTQADSTRADTTQADSPRADGTRADSTQADSTRKEEKPLIIDLPPDITGPLETLKASSDRINAQHLSATEELNKQEIEQALSKDPFVNQN